MAMELPTNPAEAIFGIYSNRGYNILEQAKKDLNAYQAYALQDEPRRGTLESIYDDVNLSIGGLF